MLEVKWGSKLVNSVLLSCETWTIHGLFVAADAAQVLLLRKVLFEFLESRFQLEDGVFLLLQHLREVVDVLVDVASRLLNFRQKIELLAS